MTRAHNDRVASHFITWVIRYAMTAVGMVVCLCAAK